MAYLKIRLTIDYFEMVDKFLDLKGIFSKLKLKKLALGFSCVMSKRLCVDNEQAILTA
jgi:hypothetical protein